VRVAIDDFGRGKASFADLQHLPVSTLKLDPSFVRAAPRDPAAAAILKAVIAMARGLKRRTIAEGIERSEQVEWLRANGCAQGQGFLFGLPLSTGAMTQRLQQQHDALAQRAVAAATLATAAVAGGPVTATPTASAALAVSAAFGATVAPDLQVDPGTLPPR
jgi:predicted signal transduction protein with EAL and GGDEF domain